MKFYLRFGFFKDGEHALRHIRLSNRGSFEHSAHESFRPIRSSLLFNIMNNSSVRKPALCKLTESFLWPRRCHVALFKMKYNINYWICDSCKKTRAQTHTQPFKWILCRLVNTNPVESTGQTSYTIGFTSLLWNTSCRKQRTNHSVNVVLMEWYNCKVYKLRGKKKRPNDCDTKAFHSNNKNKGPHSTQWRYDNNQDTYNLYPLLAKCESKIIISILTLWRIASFVVLYMNEKKGKVCKEVY